MLSKIIDEYIEFNLVDTIFSYWKSNLLKINTCKMLFYYTLF